MDAERRLSSLVFWIRRLGAGGGWDGSVLERDTVVWDFLVRSRWAVGSLLVNRYGLGGYGDGL